MKVHSEWCIHTKLRFGHTLSRHFCYKIMSVITQYKFVQDEPINPWVCSEKRF